MWEDPIVAEVHRTREKLASVYNFNVKAVFADIRKRQTALGSRLISPRKPAKTTGVGDHLGQEIESKASKSPKAMFGN
jgi:hypothetical protein